MLPTSSRGGGDTNDEIEFNYAGMVSCYFTDSSKNSEWIIDSGASDHMIGMFKVLKNTAMCNNNLQITYLPVRHPKLHTVEM